MSIKVVKEKQYAGSKDIRYTIYPFWPDRGSIIVERRRKFGSPKLSPAEINWFAAGSQDVRFTSTFHKAMSKAISIANEINKLKG